jgi:two-component system probable response regulator PhcQ
MTTHPQARPESDKPGDGRIAVLFVDDEPPALRAIERAMGRTAFEVLCAATPAEALDTMAARRVDVMVSDIDMPEMTGLELCQVVRRDHPQTIRMLLTGHATMEKALNAINEGEVARFFTKPFDAGLFVDAMDKFIERILRLRSDSESGARAARSDELRKWLVSRFPGAEETTRTAGGELIIDIPALLDQVDAAGAPGLRDMLRREG